MLGWIFHRIFQWGLHWIFGKTLRRTLLQALRGILRRFFPLLWLALLYLPIWPALPGSGLLLPVSPVQAQNSLHPLTEPRSEITRVTPLLRGDSLTIDADIDLELGDELRRAAEKGLALHFVVEVQISSTYRWWFNKTVLDERRRYRLSYNVLTRQWRVGSGDWAVPQATLDDAMATLRHVRGWAVGTVSADSALTPDRYAKGRYEGRMRLRLDTARLSRPFQIDAINRSVWTLATPWKTFQFDPPAF